MPNRYTFFQVLFTYYFHELFITKCKKNCGENTIKSQILDAHVILHINFSHAYMWPVWFLCFVVIYVYCKVVCTTSEISSDILIIWSVIVISHYVNIKPAPRGAHVQVSQNDLCFFYVLGFFSLYECLLIAEKGGKMLYVVV